MSQIERDGSKSNKKSKTGFDFYKYKFPVEARDVLKELLPSIAHKNIVEFGALSNREIAYEMTDGAMVSHTFNIFEFLDRLNLAMIKLGITFSLVHYNSESEVNYVLTIHYVKKTYDKKFKKDKSTKIKEYTTIIEALDNLMNLYLERKKFIAGAQCY